MSLALLLAVALPACSSGQQGPIVWSTDHEGGGLDEWQKDDGGGVFTNGAASAQISRDVAHGGTHSARLQIVANGTADTGARLFRWHETRTLEAAYYGAWFYFPRSYLAPDWWNIFQFKSRTATRN